MAYLYELAGCKLISIFIPFCNDTAKIVFLWLQCAFHHTRLSMYASVYAVLASYFDIPG